MANFITIGNHFVNLDKVSNIEVRGADAPKMSIVTIHSHDSVVDIPCAGNEHEVSVDLDFAIRMACSRCPRGPVSP